MIAWNDKGEFVISEDTTVKEMREWLEKIAGELTEGAHFQDEHTSVSPKIEFDSNGATSFKVVLKNEAGESTLLEYVREDDVFDAQDVIQKSFAEEEIAKIKKNVYEMLVDLM